MWPVESLAQQGQGEMRSTGETQLEEELRLQDQSIASPTDNPDPVFPALCVLRFTCRAWSPLAGEGMETCLQGWAFVI